MKGILRATGILASSSLVTVVVGVVSAKITALLIGPVGVGRIGILQSIVGMATLLAGLGIGNALVRLGANAVANDRPAEATALVRAASLTGWALGAVAALVLLLMAARNESPVITGAGAGWVLVLMAIAVPLSLSTNILTSALNAHHRIGALARVSIAGSVLGSAFSVALLWRFRDAAIPWSVLGVFAIGWLVSTIAVRRELRARNVPVPAGELKVATRALLRFGVPFMASSLVGTGVQLSLPLLVAGLLSAASVGYFRAAMTLSVGYLGFLLTAVAQDYYPRVSAAVDDPAALREMANVQIRLINLIGVPVILVAQMATPYVIPLLYSHSFMPAVDILRWQWMGDLFKLWSWALSFIVLARSGSRTFFAIEAISGTALLGGSIVGIRLLGVQGLGVAYLGTLILYLGVVWFVVRREIGFRFSASNAIWMGLSLAGSASMLALGFVQGAALRVGAGLVIAGIACAYSLSVLLTETGGPGGPLGAVVGRLRRRPA